MPAEHVAWLNGEYIPLSQASLSILDPGVLNGAIVSERLRTFKHEPFLLNEHLERFFASANAAFIDLRSTQHELGELVREVVARNAKLLPASHDLAVSFFATPGRGGPTLCVYAAAIPAHLYVTAYDDGIALAIPPTQAMPPEVLSPHIKTRNRLHWHIADAHAARMGGKALFVHADGTIAETATGNVFIVREGELWTPRRDRTLRGISQAYVFELADRLGIRCCEANFSPSDMLAASEAFVTSSVYCMLPVVELNQTQIGDGLPGPVYRQILAAWSATVGVDIAGQMVRMARGEPKD